MMPFVIAAFGVFMFLAWIFNRKTLKNTLTYFGIITIQTAILGNLEFIRVLKNTLGVVRGVGSGIAQIGWPVLWDALGFIAFPFGFKLAYGPGFWILGQYVTPVVFIVFFIAFAYFLVASFKKKPSPSFLVHISILTVFLSAFIYFRYFVEPASKIEVGHTFLQFKIAKWSSLFCVTLMGAATAFYVKRFQSKIPAVLLGSFVLFSIIANMLIVPKNITQNFLSETGYSYAPFTSFLGIREMVKDIPPDDVIYLKFGFEHYPLRQLAVYALYDRRLASDYTDDGFICGFLPEKDRVMPFNEASWVIEYAEPGKKYLKPRVGNLGLLRASDFRNGLYLSSVKDGFNRETKGKDIWYWSAKTMTFEYKRLKGMDEVKKVRIRFKHKSSSPQRNLKITIDGDKTSTFNIKTYDRSHEFISEPVSVNGNSLKIRFTTDGKTTRLSDTDSREASFQIQNFKLEPLNTN